MNRRTFLCGLSLGTLAPLAAEEQPLGKVARIGYLALHSGPRDLEDTFRQGLRDLGWVEGQNIAIERRSAEGKSERLADLAIDLVRRKVDVIFAPYTPPAQAAKKATDTIPIVFTSVADPIGVQLVADLARPGGNITGLSTINVELSAKRLELMKEAIPGVTRVAVIVNPVNPRAPFLLKQTETAATSMGLEIRVLEVRDPADLDRTFSVLSRAHTAAVMLLPDPMYVGEAQTRIAHVAVRNRLPIMTAIRDITESGGLISYGPNQADLWRRAAIFVDKILKGTKPGDLPVEQPTKFELVINLKTARALGLTIPPALLLRADHVIE